MAKLLNWLGIPELSRVNIWRIRMSGLPWWKVLLVSAGRILLRALRDFREDRIWLRASALTFFTLMSIVPILALSFGIAKGFGFERRLETQLRGAFHGQEEVIERAIEFANQLLLETRGGLVAGIGLVILVWTVVKVLSNIEESFNAIWGLKRSRHFLRKFSDYLSFLFVSPILIFLSSSLTVFITSQVNNILESLDWLGFLGPLIFSLLRLIPFILTWVLFTFTYMFIPNTRVNFTSAMMAGIIAGTAYQVAQITYVNFQFGANRAGAIYGSFAALPLFLTWLQISWMIVLFGAELCNAHQNLEQYEWGEDSTRASERFRRLVMLEMTRQCALAFREGNRPPTYQELRDHIDAPPRFVRECLNRLLDTHIIVEAHWEEDKKGSDITVYQPGFDVNRMTIAEVIRRMEDHGSEDIPIGRTSGVKELEERMEALRSSHELHSGNILLVEVGKFREDSSGKTGESA